MKATTMHPPRQEFERKFFVYQPELPAAWPEPPQHIVQAYLHTHGPCVRVRIYDDLRGILELKGDAHVESSPMDLPVDEARWFIDHERKGYVIEKLRYRVPGPAGLFWEVDVYQDEENTSLMVVEIETPTKDFPLDSSAFPKWVGREIAAKSAFSNANLSRTPFLHMTAADVAFAREAMGIIV